MVTEVRD